MLILPLSARSTQRTPTKTSCDKYTWPAIVELGCTNVDGESLALMGAKPATRRKVLCWLKPAAAACSWLPMASKDFEAKQLRCITGIAARANFAVTEAATDRELLTNIATGTVYANWYASFHFESMLSEDAGRFRRFRADITKCNNRLGYNAYAARSKQRQRGLLTRVYNENAGHV
jgi:hypothetical protein